MARCPTCNRSFDPAITASTPFCSERCRDTDLRRWLDEKYAFPSERELPEDQWPDEDAEGRDEP